MNWLDSFKSLFGNTTKETPKAQEISEFQATPEVEPIITPATRLYFADAEFDERNLKDFQSILPRQRVMHVDNTVFVLRHLKNHIVFREQSSASTAEAYFLTDKALPESNEEISAISKEQFTSEFRRAAFGRCVLYVDPLMQNEDCVYFFFAPDGRGFARHLKAVYHYYSRPEKTSVYWDYSSFRWDAPERLAMLGIDAEDKNLRQTLFQTDAAVFQPLCRELFHEKINAEFGNPYMIPGSLEEIPTAWTCGSESNLRALTHAICCTEPGLFDSGEPVRVIYKANRPYKRGGLKKVMRDYDIITNGRMMSLCELAFRLNQFEGLKWERMVGWDEETDELVDKPAHRRNSFRAQPHIVSVKIAPPSVHERAEAFLTLVDWLDEILHNPQKRERLLAMPKM